MRRTLETVELAILVGACAPAAVAPCAGPPPALADCVYGSAWAECGGSGGEPRFACQGCSGWFGSTCCLWFENGCVAEGFVPTRCPNDDLCCFGDRSGSPFDAEDEPVSSIAIAWTTVGWGREAWDRARESGVDVVLGPTSSEPRPFVDCTSPLPQGPCGADERAVTVNRLLHGALVVTVTDGGLSHYSDGVVVEVMREGDGALTARVCLVRSTDYSDGTCQGGDGPICATSGTLTISAFPTTEEGADAMSIDVTATLPDGSPVVLRL